MELAVSGYNHKQSNLLERILHRIANLNINSARFDALKEKVLLIHRLGHLIAIKFSSSVARLQEHSRISNSHKPVRVPCTIPV